MIADVLVELELSLNRRDTLRAAVLVDSQSLPQCAAFRVFEQVAQGLVETKRGTGVRHKKPRKAALSRQPGPITVCGVRLSGMAPFGTFEAVAGKG